MGFGSRFQWRRWESLSPSRVVSTPRREFQHQDSGTFSTHQLIIPVLRTLSRRYPALQFAVSIEVSNDVDVDVSEEYIDLEEDEDEYAPIHRMSCRVDMSIKACRLGETELYVVLLIEQKAGVIGSSWLDLWLHNAAPLAPL